MLTDIQNYGKLIESGRIQVHLSNVLSPWSTYSFRVLAINEQGKGEFSDPSPEYDTGKDSPHVAPSNVGGGRGKIGELNITWDVSSSQHFTVKWNDIRMSCVFKSTADIETKYFKPYFCLIYVHSQLNIGINFVFYLSQYLYKLCFLFIPVFLLNE